MGKGQLFSPIPLSADEVREKLSIHEELVHISVEINYQHKTFRQRTSRKSFIDDGKSRIATYWREKK